jgi:hypothetical protein
MKTLLDKLKDHHVIKLHHSENNQPNMVQSIFDDLNYHTHWLSLTYRTICCLVYYLDLPNYSPETIEKLFNEE